MSAPLLEAVDLVRTFGGGRDWAMRRKPAVHAVRGVSLEVARGETLGIVGESGCGKSTLARLLVGLDRPTEGRIRLGGEALFGPGRKTLSDLARQVQYVFQDPISSLNPRKTIRQILSAPLRHLRGLAGKEAEARMHALMDEVKLRPEFLDRYPHEFSGGQAQRIGIARALAAEPQLLVLDEPVSALDVSVQAQVLSLLDELKRRLDLTYVFISHDLAVVEAVSDRVAVMYSGRVVERAAAADLLTAARHPYSRLLFDSAPVPGKRQVRAEDQAAELPDPLAPPQGCAFAPRCAYRRERCGLEMPELDTAAGAHQAACFNPLAG